MALTPEQRTAQRKLVGVLNLKSGMWFEPAAGLCIWRGQRASEEWGLGIPELSVFLDELAVDYSVRIEMMTIAKRKTPGFTAVIAWNDLDVLTKWVPSFRVQIENALSQIDDGSGKPNPV